jgi:hypothetical protein
LTVQDFPLPSFDDDAEALREALRFGSGFVAMKGLPIDRYSEQEACMLYWGTWRASRTADSADNERAICCIRFAMLSRHPK